jgi:bifunctional non-homologous end joining protein LigD
MQESVALRFKKGSSNKDYNVELVQSGDGWLVNFSYGAHGGAMTAGTKTKAPLPYDKAKKIYDKLVNSKKAKGYSPDGEGVAFAGTEHQGRVTGYQPQLLNTVSEDEILAKVAAEPGAWAGQEKFDGKRRGFKVEDGKIVASNRKGLQVPVLKAFEEAVEKLAARGLKEFEIDCEDMGSYLAVFDLLGLEGEDLRELPEKKRLEKLHIFEVLAETSGADDVFRTAVTWTLETPALAVELITKMREKNAEGVVFKRIDAPYTAGKPNSGGDQLKLKFTQDATVRVAAQNDGKRSVSMELMKGGCWTFVGNVTIPTNHEIPEVGTLVDVNYLYAYDGGALFQPVYRGPRDDLDESAATVDQLVFKAEAAA